MNSLKEVYFAMAEQDHTKLAQANAVEQYGQEFIDVDPGLVKQAQDYDAIGRIMAENVFTDMVKEAVDDEMAGYPEKEKKKEVASIVAKAKGEAPSKEEEEEKEKEKEEYEKKEPETEKKASIRHAILQRMQQDPEYVSSLLSKYEIG